jgi:hypothetical protein
MYVNVSAEELALVSAPMVTVTSTGPAAWTGVVAVIVVAFTKVTPVAGLPPTLTVGPAAKLVPVIVIESPPSTDPLLGLTPLTVGAGGGGALYVNVTGVALVCPDAVTVMLAGPAAWAGMFAFRVVALTNVIEPAATGTPSTLTMAPAAKFVPLITTAVPPTVEPLFGVTALTVGAGGGATYVKVSAAMTALACPPTVTITSTMPAA